MNKYLINVLIHAKTTVSGFIDAHVTVRCVCIFAFNVDTCNNMLLDYNYIATLITLLNCNEKMKD